MKRINGRVTNVPAIIDRKTDRKKDRQRETDTANSSIEDY